MRWHRASPGIVASTWYYNLIEYNQIIRSDTRKRPPFVVDWTQRCYSRPFAYKHNVIRLMIVIVLTIIFDFNLCNLEHAADIIDVGDAVTENSFGG